MERAFGVLRIKEEDDGGKNHAIRSLCNQVAQKPFARIR
jgi:peptidyl-tRNA hydrolase